MYSVCLFVCVQTFFSERRRAIYLEVEFISKTGLRPISAFNFQEKYRRDQVLTVCVAYFAISQENQNLEP